MGPTRHAAHGQERPGEPAPGPPHSSGDERPLPGRGASAPSPHAFRIVWWCGPTTAGVRGLGLGLLRPRRPTRARTLDSSQADSPLGLVGPAVCVCHMLGSAGERRRGGRPWGHGRLGTMGTGRPRPPVGGEPSLWPPLERTHRDCPPCPATEVRRGRPRPSACLSRGGTDDPDAPDELCWPPRARSARGLQGRVPSTGAAPPRPGAEEAQAPRPRGQPALRGPRSPHR